MNINTLKNYLYSHTKCAVYYVMEGGAYGGRRLLYDYVLHRPTVSGGALLTNRIRPYENRKFFIILELKLIVQVYRY